MILVTTKLLDLAGIRTSSACKKPAVSLNKDRQTQCNQGHHNRYDRRRALFALRDRLPTSWLPVLSMRAAYTRPASLLATGAARVLGGVLLGLLGVIGRKLAGARIALHAILRCGMRIARAPGGAWRAACGVWAGAVARLQLLSCGRTVALHREAAHSRSCTCTNTAVLAGSTLH